MDRFWNHLIINKQVREDVLTFEFGYSSLHVSLRQWLPDFTKWRPSA
jgi:hypothetical protein